MKKNIIIFGEVLFDRFTDGHSVLGGAPFNVSWHLQAFGLSPLFISRIGNDPLGSQVTEAMKNWDMNTDGVQIDQIHPTGAVEITLNNDEPAYNIKENAAWDFIAENELPPLSENAILYHGSLALRNETSKKTWKSILNTYSPSVYLDVNLRTPWYTKKAVSNLIKSCTWLKINESEYQEICLHNKELQPETMWITAAQKGATLYKNGETYYTVSPTPVTDVADTVGAGDAFCAVLILGIIHGWDEKQTMDRAQDFASSIVTIRGATTDDRLFYEPFLKKWSLYV